MAIKVKAVLFLKFSSQYKHQSRHSAVYPFYPLGLYDRVLHFYTGELDKMTTLIKAT